jgi:hypothetical protein
LLRDVNLGGDAEGRASPGLPDALVQRPVDDQIRPRAREALMRSLLSDGHFLKIAGALKSMPMPVLDIGRADYRELRRLN